MTPQDSRFTGWDMWRYKQSTACQFMTIVPGDNNHKNLDQTGERPQNRANVPQSATYERSFEQHTKQKTHRIEKGRIVWTFTNVCLKCWQRKSSTSTSSKTKSLSGWELNPRPLTNHDTTHISLPCLPPNHHSQTGKPRSPQIGSDG